MQIANAQQYDFSVSIVKFLIICFQEKDKNGVA